MYGGPKGLGDPNYRHVFFSNLLISSFCTCREMSKMEEDPMIPQVRIFFTFASVCALLLDLIFFCRECETSQERNCAPRRFQATIWINLKLLSVYSYFLYFWHTWCLSVAFCICVSRWLSFLNVPKPTDSPLSCTVGRQRMTWFSSVFTSSPSQS